jgi:hypothetical protein
MKRAYNSIFLMQSFINSIKINCGIRLKIKRRKIAIKTVAINRLHQTKEKLPYIKVIQR